ncbi:hypothetical protein EYF80_018851 [Liparis tanakae]|uniref:Uncharacterized protein n=1 Tax=Liparis tanakae TaxID=230148 RepID=A0A4Z2HYD9_9TELE|nr:hypothetical protein EYF80_018851 [Liparis tanakae]
MQETKAAGLSFLTPHQSISHSSATEDHTCDPRGVQLKSTAAPLNPITILILAVLLSDIFICSSSAASRGGFPAARRRLQGSTL